VGALTLNLGRGGLAVRTMNPLEVSTSVPIQLRLPRSSHAIEAACRVVWQDRRVGMGLQFEHMDASAQTAIDDYVDGQDPPTSNTAEPNRET
jgi:Tfp pilus assembly protein PilZ